jgi:nucleotide-binding universal stress UspA family protein
MMMTFRKIVIGIDFSRASLASAHWVATHLAHDAELFLVHVVPLPKAPAYLLEHLSSTIDHRSTQVPRLFAALREFADLLGADSVRVGIRTGVPSITLARVAAEVKADLICVGRGPKRQGSSRFGATTPQRLLGISSVPVLVIPQGPLTKPRRVAAALSCRPGSEVVAAMAAAVARGSQADLEAIHVLEPDVRINSSISPVLRHGTMSTGNGSSDNGRVIGIDSLEESDLYALARESIMSTVGTSGAALSHDPVIRFGDVGQELIAAARQTSDPPLIVLGRLGETVTVAHSARQYRCGSTTRLVVWAAPGPVLVLPLEEHPELYPCVPESSLRMSAVGESKIA